MNDLMFYLIVFLFYCSKEEIEKCKKRDMLEQLLAEMAGEFPTIGEVFVNERDIFLTNSLQRAARNEYLIKGMLINCLIVDAVFFTIHLYNFRNEC